MRLDYKIIGGFLFFLASMFFLKDTFAQQTLDLKSEIFPKLTDRRCMSMPLDKCSCPDAREMKAYIEALIETGAKKDDIFYKVAKKFSPLVILDKQLKAEMEKRVVREIGENRPQISLEVSFFDFGQVSKKQGSVKKTIAVYNKGTKDLIITDIKVSCSCTTVSLTVDKNKSPYFGMAGAGPGWQMVIEPDKTGELEVIFDAANSAVKIGKAARELSIISNDPLYSQVQLKLEAQVSE